MCGILGSFTQYSISDPDLRAKAALRAMHHRGPDDHGLEAFSVANGRLNLGQARLSIIDLSPGGHQPKQSHNGRYVIVFNGEIYNYRELRQELSGLGYSFHTESDTEVLLAGWAQWGIASLSRLIGMFAFVVFDRKEETITLVRDAFGIKPLFYHKEGKGIALASEIPALLEMIPAKPAMNLQRAYSYLVNGSYDDGADSFYEGVYHLRPGHWLRIHLGKPAVQEPQRWWWPSIAERKDLSFKEAAAQLREMFFKNIRLHLRSDVPLGVALSGGIDSSAVVCAIRNIEPQMPIQTFSFIAQGSAVNEERWVDLVNKRVGANAHKVIVDPKELGRDLDDMIKAQGEPFGDTSIYAQYRVLRLAREHGITVTLDGQGADEMLAGYNGYPLRYLSSLIEKQQYHKIPGFINSWSKWPGRSRNEAMKMLATLAVSPDTKKMLRKFTGRNDQPPSWINHEWLEARGVDMNPSTPVYRNVEAYGRRLAEELRDALTNKGLVSLMRHADRNSMRWSIESRVPFLTTELAEFLLTLPEHYLLSPKGETKSVFREAMRGVVPNEILDRRDKIGFQTPEQAWLKGQQAEIKNWMEALIDLPFLNTDAIRKKVDEIIENNQVYNTEAWRLINFSRWAQLQKF
jgi:asparagine synthase (glutamine-hydrolysing)